MPDTWTRILISTLREVPAEAEVPSHQLMLRAGLIRRVAAGTYDYLPLGLRALRKAMDIVREEMNRAGACEVLMPALQPIQLWEQTGRRKAYGENLFVVTDRHGREQALGPTHEEVTTEMIGGCIDSYKQLPLNVYQIQTKFRDEFRPRFGVLRSREFQMKDAYSFHMSLDGPGSLRETYDFMYQAYRRIFTRCGLPFRVVEAESGPIGGAASHEFMVPSPTGEDTILESDKLDENGEPNYAANIEKAQIGDRPYSFDHEPAGIAKKVHTPGCSTIDDVADFFKTTPDRVLKTLIFEASLASRDKVNKEHEYQRTHTPGPRDMVPERFYVLAVVRGDHDVNTPKLEDVVKSQINAKVHTVAMLEDREAVRLGFALGFVGPQTRFDMPLTRVVVDPDAIQSGDLIVGGNQKDYHLQHFNWKRDYIDKMDPDHKHVIADIRNALDGDPSPLNDGGKLRTRKGIELGHIFQLGDKYTRALDVSVLDQNGKPFNPLMGCYGIGVNRILAAAIERDGGNDDNGIIWPSPIAPYTVVITAIKYKPDNDVAKACHSLAEQLETAGLDVIIDDRDERPGVKFKDADLIGFPFRIVVGDKGLDNNQVELKARDGSLGDKGENVPLDQVVERIRQHAI